MPTGFYGRVSTRDCLKFRELKYGVVTATKVVGKHFHPNLHPSDYLPGPLLSVVELQFLNMVMRVWHRYTSPETLSRGPVTTDGGWQRSIVDHKEKCPAFSFDLTCRSKFLLASVEWPSLV